ncbi:hypothetical protein L208DRAFT_1427141 [Tricholoma matsutake]|nr:hypothetical protein L208DRAFT_1427141 [Tricholoma matsutake 945]
MYLILFGFSFLCYQVGAAHLYHSSPRCLPLSTTFSSSSVSSVAPFVAITPRHSYQTTQAGLELYMERPQGAIKSKNGVNDKIAEGATVNSTFTILYGRISFQIIAPTTPGVVTAAILIADERDEIDIELLGGDAKHWQTNIFVSSPKDDRPLYGVFSSVEPFPSPASSTSQSHTYTIDWNKDRIQWSVDGTTYRTLKQEDTWKDGVWRYPSRPARIQMGIWDASSASGTSEWARGPVNWQTGPPTIKAVFERVSVECPNY